MKGRLLGCALLLFAGVLLIAWWLPKTHTAFWLILIGGLAVWIGGIYLKVRFARTDATLGSAQFGSRADVNALAKNKGDLLIGRDTLGRLLRYDGPAHLITIAPTRSGKGVGTIIPNLLTANRSVVCIDPKGENACVTLRQREAFGPVHCLDPFGISGRATARYNPLDRLDADSLDLAEDAMTLADALVFDEVEAEAHWNEEAKALISGIILYVVCHDDPAHRNLTSVRDYLTLAPDDFTALLTVMQASDGAGGLIARAANRYLSKSHREAAGVLSGAQRHTHFLDSPRIAQVVNGSDFAFADLKDSVATVFLILPPDRLDTYSRWLRLLVAQAISEMARSSAKPPRPVLFLLDEFAALGRLQPVERAMGLMAGYPAPPLTEEGGSDADWFKRLDAARQEASALSKAQLAQGESDRTHTEIQAWLRDLGKALGFDIWIAANDRGRLFDGEPLGKNCLEHLPAPITTAPGADAVRLIDVLWLDRGGPNVVAAFEVEHSTSIYSGIVRMLDLALSGSDLHAAAGLFLVAPDSREADVRAQIQRPAFSRIGDLDISYLPYGELEKNRDAIARFGSGLKAIRAIARSLT